MCRHLHLLLCSSLIGCAPHYFRTEYFGEASAACLDSTMAALGDRDLFMGTHWQDVLRSVDEPSLLARSRTEIGLTAYRISVFEVGGDQVPIHYQRLRALVRAERRNSSTALIEGVRDGSRFSHSMTSDDTAWRAVANCWDRQPAPPLGTGCRQLSEGDALLTAYGGVADWILYESVRDGRYLVTDFITSDIANHPAPEPTTVAPVQGASQATSSGERERLRRAPK